MTATFSPEIGAKTIDRYSSIVTQARKEERILNVLKDLNMKIKLPEEEKK